MSAVGDARKRQQPVVVFTDDHEQCDYLIREARAEALREARDALYRGEGPDMFEDSDIVYGEWLSNRADRIEAGDA